MNIGLDLVGFIPGTMGNIDNWIGTGSKDIEGEIHVEIPVLVVDNRKWNNYWEAV